MRTLFTTTLISLLSLGTVMAQVPQLINYQGVARDSEGLQLTDRNIGLRLSILGTSINGTAVYIETHTTTTNAFGLFNIQIGNGIFEDGSMTTIDWSANTYYLKVEMDDEGGAAYDLMGTQQLVSVPYALHAKNSSSTQSLNNYPVATTPPQAGQLLQWDGNSWVPVTLQAPTTNNSLVFTTDGF